ncbi:hypothetical protein [Brucella anthropi]
MWPFGKRKLTTVSTRLPVSETGSSSLIEAFDERQSATIVKRQAVHEAVLSLGLLKPASEELLLSFLNDGTDVHPRQTLSDYRRGEQLSKDEKKALGIRSNAFFSRDAFNDLTECGRKNP